MKLIFMMSTKMVGTLMIYDNTIIYRVWDKEEYSYQGAYSRACGDEFNFSSPSAARNSMFSGKFENKEKYDIHKYKLVRIEDWDEETHKQDV